MLLSITPHQRICNVQDMGNNQLFPAERLAEVFAHRVADHRVESTLLRDRPSEETLTLEEQIEMAYQAWKKAKEAGRIPDAG